MLPTNKDQALHKSVMFKVLINLLDDTFLSQSLYFKGGTCASMLGYLDRFSVDLDFDVSDETLQPKIREGLEKLFSTLDLEIKDSSGNTVQYFLRYDAPLNSRNTLKIDAVDTPHEHNRYEKKLLPEINRYAICQTKETMFTNKLVALTSRYERNESIAGRDVYDIYHYLRAGTDLIPELIEERCQMSVEEYVAYVSEFIQEHVSQTIINQDLNTLLDYAKFNALRNSLKDETLALLRGLL